MWHATFARIRFSRGRLLLTVFAVAVGVAFLTASLVLAGSTRAALEDSYRQVYAGVDAVVRGREAIGGSPFAHGGTPLPADVAQRIRTVPGVEHVEGRVSTVAQLLAGDDGEAAVATGLPTDPERAAIVVRTGRLPVTGGEVAVDAAAASVLRLEPGSSVRILLPDGVLDATVVGTVGFGRLDALAGGARVLFDHTTAESRFGDDGYAEIAVRGQDEVDPDALRARIGAVLGGDLQVLTAAGAAARDAAAAAGQTQLVSRIVLAVAVVALGIGGFMIAGTFRMLVGQRVHELALLRAVGATRRQVAVSLLAEAGVIGGAGAVLGVGAGIGAGALLVTTSRGLMPGLPPASPVITSSAMLVPAGVGIVLAVLAARGAARRALEVPPVAAMRQVTAPGDEVSRRRVVTGTIVLTVGLATVVIGTTSGSQAALLAGAAGIIVGVGLVFPLVTGPVLTLISRPIGRVGVTGSLARRQTLAAPRRVGSTAAMLAVTLGLVSFLLVVNASLGAATPRLLDQRQQADFVIRSTARSGLHDVLFGVVDELASQPEVAVAEVVTYGEARISGPAADNDRPHPASLFVVDPSAVADLFDVHPAEGDLAGMGAGDLAVRDTVARANGWRRGDVLSVTFPDGTTAPLTVAALFHGAVTTDWIVGPGTADRHLPAAYREAFVVLVEGIRPAAARTALEEVVTEASSVTLLSRDEQAAQTTDANERSLGILTALFSLSLAVGALGVTNTLTFSVLERVRELGLLRAVGATRGQVRSIVHWEAALTSALGALVGVSLGLSLAWIAVRVLPEGTVIFTVPITHVAFAVAATIGLGTAASVLPAARAARTDVLRALQLR